MSHNPASSKTYQMIQEKISKYFNISHKSVGTRFNWYRDSSDWKVCKGMEDGQQAESHIFYYLINSEILDLYFHHVFFVTLTTSAVNFRSRLNFQLLKIFSYDFVTSVWCWGVLACWLVGWLAGWLIGWLADSTGSSLSITTPRHSIPKEQRIKISR